MVPSEEEDGAEGRRTERPTFYFTPFWASEFVPHLSLLQIWKNLKELFNIIFNFCIIPHQMDILILY